jgi:hypothetical protein
MYNPSIKEEDKCESTDVSKDSIIQSTLKDIINQFDKNYDISKAELLLKYKPLVRVNEGIICYIKYNI